MDREGAVIETWRKFMLRTSDVLQTELSILDRVNRHEGGGGIERSYAHILTSFVTASDEAVLLAGSARAALSPEHARLRIKEGNADENLTALRAKGQRLKATDSAAVFEPGEESAIKKDIADNRKERDRAAIQLLNLQRQIEEDKRRHMQSVKLEMEKVSGWGPVAYFEDVDQPGRAF